MNTLTLTLSNTSIRQDLSGKFCLNDLHQAAGNLKRHRPGYFLETQQAQELIAEISKAVIPALEQNQVVSVTHGGNYRGTFVVKELVYAYAMWISAKFNIAVIRAYDALVTEKPAEQPYLASLQGPLTPAQFQHHQQALNKAQKTLLSLPIVITATELLKLKGKPDKAKAIAPRKWTQEERDAAEQMRAEGHPMSRIAKQLHRTTASVIAYFRYTSVKQVQQQGGVQ